jgi:hypothetical protein
VYRALQRSNHTPEWAGEAELSVHVNGVVVFLRDKPKVRIRAHFSITTAHLHTKSRHRHPIEVCDKSPASIYPQISPQAPKHSSVSTPLLALGWSPRLHVPVIATRLSSTLSSITSRLSSPTSQPQLPNLYIQLRFTSPSLWSTSTSHLPSRLLTALHLSTLFAYPPHLSSTSTPLSIHVPMKFPMTYRTANVRMLVADMPPKSTHVPMKEISIPRAVHPMNP